MPDNDVSIWVVDYPGHHDGGRVSDLDLEQYGYRVSYLLDGRLPDTPAADVYATTLRDRETDMPSIVVGHCVGAAVAHHLAVATDALLVLLDPELADFGVVMSEFSRIVREVTRADPEPAEWHVRDELRTDRQAFLARLADQLACLIAKHLFAGEPDAHEASAVLTKAYIDWLTYVVSGFEPTLPSRRGGIVQLASAEHKLPECWPHAPRHRVAVVRSQLTRSPATRVTMLDIIANRQAYNA